MRRFFTLLLLCLGALRAADWDEAAAQLLRTLEPVLNPREPLAIAFESRVGPEQAGEAAGFRRAFQAGVRQRGQRTGPGGAALRVVLSENPRGWVLVAEFRRENSAETRLLEWPKSGPGRSSTAQVSLQHELLGESEEAVLDAAPAERGLLMLTSSGVQFTREGRTEKAAAPLPLRLPRDPRGRLEVQAGGVFIARYPGWRCEGRIAPALSLECAAAPEDRWPVALDLTATPEAGRNTFLAEGSNAAFLSAAAISANAWALASVSGSKPIVDRTLRVVARPITSGMGSDLAGLQASCGTGWQVLSSGNGGAKDPDTVTAFEYSAGQLRPLSEPVARSGPITALWTLDKTSAVEVVHDLKTDRYEVSRVGVVCSR